jgi:hemolysin activation/secretion protein
MLGTLLLKAVASSIFLAMMLGAVTELGFAQESPVLERPGPRQLEEPTYLPEKPAEPFQLPPVEESTPVPGARGPTLEVTSVVFEGNNAIATRELQGVAAPYVGRAVTRIELEQLREAVSRHYLERGYVNSGAVFPDNFYHAGVVRLQIIEGRVEEVRLSGMGRLRDGYVRSRLIRGDEPLNVNVVQERFQLLLADPLFSKINARLQPGSKLGLARLDLDVTRGRPWDLSLFANNYRSPSVGSEAIGVTGRVRNLTGLGDAFDATLQGGHHDNDRYGVGWAVPVTARTQLHARYDNGKSSVLEAPLDALDVKSELKSQEVGIDQTFIETIRRHFSVGVSFIHRENRTALLGEPFSFVPGEGTGTSKVNAWRFDQDFVQRWEKQALALRSTFTFGRTNTVENAQFSDIIPPKRYSFWLGQTQFTRRLLESGGDLALRANMQFSRDKLVPLERFAIGGASTVRGYRENQAVRDQGFNITVEFRYPLFDRPVSHHRLTLIPFADYGEAWNKGEQRDALASAGLGFNYQFRGLSAELYYGKRLIEPDVKTSGDLQDDGFHFQVRYEI